MESVVFILTLTFSAIIAFSLFAIEQSVGFNFETLVAFMDLGVMFSVTFAYFFFSERITTDLSEIGEIFYYSPWYGRLTAKQQKLLVLILQRSQREVRLTGMGLFDCSLPIFKAVRIHPWS